MLYTTKGRVSTVKYTVMAVVRFCFLLFLLFFYDGSTLEELCYYGIYLLWEYYDSRKKRYAESYITLLNDKIEGKVISGPKDIIEIKYSDIQSLNTSADQNKIIVRDHIGEFVFQAEQDARIVAEKIYAQMESAIDKV